MDYRRLGKTELQVSAIGLGCVTFGREIDEHTSFAVMDHAFEHGMTLFDTAEAYSDGGSEQVVGRWLSARGTCQRIVLATKVSGALTRQRIVSSAEASLRRLKTDSLDLFQLHRWDGDVPLEEMLEALDSLVRRGLVRYVGCSNYAAWQVCKALWSADKQGWSRMESVQSNYNLVVRDIERELLAFCADQQVGMITYSPLGGSFLAGMYRQDTPVPKGTRFDIIPGYQEIYFHEAGFRILRGLQAVAHRTGFPATQLALAWVLSRSGITSTLIGAESTAQVDQAFAAAEWVLPTDLRTELSNL